MNRVISYACLVGMMALVVPLSACARQYSAEPIEAWVVDAETKQPLEGVIVVAHWQLFYSTVGGRVPGDQLMVLEAVTDKDGKFTFPAWGPKKVPKYKPQKGDVWIAHIPFLVPDSYLDDRDPALILFKPGYEYRRLQNPSRSTTDHSTVRRSMWNGKTIELKKFKGSLEEQLENFRDINNDLEFSTDTPEKCDWKKIPKIVVAVSQQRRIFEENGIHDVSSLDQHLISNDEYYAKKGGKQCGLPSAFIRGLQQ